MTGKHVELTKMGGWTLTPNSRILDPPNHRNKVPSLNTALEIGFPLYLTNEVGI